jgi:hypothetical protein
VLEIPVNLCPPEETIWSKAFVLDRERCDAADVAHLLRARATHMDWQRLVRRFGPHWQLLLAHLMLFRFIYPDEAEDVPTALLTQLLERVTRETSAATEERAHQGAPLCRGTLISWGQYLVDVGDWGYRDARLPPTGTLTPDEIARWTAAEK